MFSRLHPSVRRPSLSHFSPSLSEGASVKVCEPHSQRLERKEVNCGIFLRWIDGRNLRHLRVVAKKVFFTGDLQA